MRVSGEVRADRVIFSWVTNASLAVSIRGRIVLLDTYINRPELPPAAGAADLRRSPISVQELVALAPEAIFLGHGHGDHADNAAYIAKQLDIPIYSSPETCDAMQADVQRMFNDPNLVNGGVRIIPNGLPVNCISPISRASVPGAEVVNIHQLDPVACIVAFKHIHSGSVPTDPNFPFIPVNPDSDPREPTANAGVPTFSPPSPPLYPTLMSLTPPTNGTPVPGQMNLRTTGAAQADRSVSSISSLQATRITSRSSGTTRPARLKRVLGPIPGCLLRRSARSSLQSWIPCRRQTSNSARS